MKRFNYKDKQRVDFHVGQGFEIEGAYSYYFPKNMRMKTVIKKIKKDFPNKIIFDILKFVDPITKEYNYVDLK